MAGGDPDDGVEATTEHALAVEGCLRGAIDSLSCGSSITALLMRSRSSLFWYTTHANAITSPSLSCTACGNDVIWPGCTSSLIESE